MKGFPVAHLLSFSEGYAVAFTVPHRNYIATIDFGLDPTEVFIRPPYEELIHASQTTPLVPLLVRADAYDDTQGGHAMTATIRDHCRWVEGLTDLSELYDRHFRSASEYAHVLSSQYLGFHRDYLPPKIRGGELIQLNRAYRTLSSLYDGEASLKEIVPLYVLGKQVLLHYNGGEEKFLGQCLQAKNRWSDEIGLRDLAKTNPHIGALHVPMDVFHKAVGESAYAMGQLLHWGLMGVNDHFHRTLNLSALSTSIDGCFADTDAFLIIASPAKKEARVLNYPIPMIGGRMSPSIMQHLEKEMDFWYTQGCQLSGAYEPVHYDEKPPPKWVEISWTRMGEREGVVDRVMQRYLVMLDLWKAFEHLFQKERIECPFCQHIVNDVGSRDPDFQVWLESLPFTKKSKEIKDYLLKQASRLGQALHYEANRVTLSCIKV